LDYFLFLGRFLFAVLDEYDSPFMIPDNSRDAQHLFAKHYAQLTDGELLEIALQPWALSDAAWEALEDELDRRELEPPEPEPAPIAPEKRSLVLLRRFRDLPEALLAKGSLDSSGIESVLADDNVVRVDWLWSNLLGGVKLLVNAENVESANEILNQPIPENFDFEGDADYHQPRCPKCQSMDISFEELDKPIAYGSLFMNLPVPLHRKGWICHSCKHTWREDETGPNAEST
jgi:hypothetical protein